MTLRAMPGAHRVVLDEAPSTPYSVGAALDDYLEWYRAHRKGIKQTEYVVERHLRKRFGKRSVDSLTAKELRTWHQGLAETRSEATANRILTVLKAALNRAWEDGQVTDDGRPWARVKPFRGAGTPRVRFLTQAECRRLINACDGSFRALVHGALVTGCRYGELRAMEVADYQPQIGTVVVRDAKDGNSRVVPLTDEGSALFDSLTAGRPRDIVIFQQDDGRPWTNYLQVRRIQTASKRAGIEPHANFHILRHTYASQLVQAGASLYAVSKALGHADVRMTTRHYAHLTPSHVAEVIRAHLPQFGDLPHGPVRIERGRDR